MGFFTAEHKGDVMARMTGDVGEVENSIMQSLDMMLKNPIMIIACLAMMIALSWQLTLFVLVLLPFAGWAIGRVGKALKRTSLETQNQWGRLMSNIEETLGGLRIIKAFVAEDKVQRRFHSESQTLYKLSNRVARRQALAHPMSEFMGTITIAIVLWFGGVLILNGTSAINAASFIYYLVIFYSMINPAKEITKAGYTIQRGMASLERVDRILNAENPITDPAHPVQLSSLRGEIDYRDVSFSYDDGQTQVLHNVSLHVPAGATVAVVGQSGSGKSTLVDLLPRFYDVESGSITIDGVDLRQMAVADLRSHMGNVNQEAILFNDTIYNNITFGVDHATREQVEEAARIANAHDFIIATEDGYDTNIGDRGCRLSGGQRQRLSIARAILKNPPILILDEATSALDSESEHLVQEALDRLMKNRTTLVIAHRLSTIKSADLIAVMHEGRIAEAGTHQELLALNGLYKKLVDMQKF
jgi:ABC-type multidrug transport system fused ATPase/permease subunit